MELFDQIKELLDDPLSVELALWFHDAIYNTRSKNNEEKSAELAAQKLKKLGVTQDIAERVAHLILLTEHPNVPHTNDEQYFLDIDLSVLGVPQEMFDEYEENIRAEYKWVPSSLFKRQRKKLLQSFLDQDQIYYSSYFSRKLEETARENLRRSLQKL